MADMPKSTIRSLIDTAILVEEYENRVIALAKALAADGDDPGTAAFLRERLDKRQASLVGFRRGLDALINLYRREQENAKAADATEVES